MKVSRTAAVLVGCCALAATATADVVGAAKTGKPGKMETHASDVEAGNNHGGNTGSQRRANRALRGGGGAGHAIASTESGKAAKTHGGRAHTAAGRHHKKRSLKVKSQKGTGAGGGGGGNGGGNGSANRAYAAAAANGGQAADNTPYVNNKFDYLDRYSAYLTPEQLQRLRTNAPPVPRDDETNVGGAEEAVGAASAAAAAAAAASSHSSYTQTAAVQEGPATTPYVSTLSRQDSGGQPGGGGGDSNDDNERGYDATGTGNADALNRGFEAEAPIAGYSPATGYGSTGDGGAANANGNGSGGALDATTATPTTPARPIVQTTEWRPIDRDVWVEHYVPGVGGNANPNGPTTSNPNNANNSANASFPNRNPSLSTGGGSANANRISATSAPCDGANPSAAPSLGIQHVFEDALWGTCSTTEDGCNPGSCCLFHPTFHRGACVPFAEICEPGERPGEGGCPYPWMTSDLCRCAGTGSGAVLP